MSDTGDGAGSDPDADTDADSGSTPAGDPASVAEAGRESVAGDPPETDPAVDAESTTADEAGSALDPDVDPDVIDLPGDGDWSDGVGATGNAATVESPGDPRDARGSGDGREGRVRVVGTAHVSADSVEEVREVVRDERPDVVAVELDEGRYRQLRGGTPDDIEAADLLKGNTVFQFLAYWMLSYVQSRMGDEFDVTPGADMMAAVEAATDHGAEVALVDRDIQTTMQRFWKRMTGIEKLRLVGGLAFGARDPRIAGLTLGIVLGFLFGPLVALFGGSVGITTAVLQRVTGGVALAAVVGYLVDRFGRGAVPDEDRRFALAVGGGLGVGLLAGVGLGVVDPLVARLGGFVVGAVGSMTIGIAGGLVVGGLLALVMSVTGWGTVEGDEEFEEFDVSSLTDTDVVTAMMEEFRQFSPGGAAALIDERDAFIAHRLVALRATGANVVAVVGAGHREGIERYLRTPDTLPPMSSLTGESGDGRRLPWGKIVGFAITAVFVAFFGLLALSTVDNADLVRLFAAWFVVNGLIAGGLAKLAGARWPSAVVGGAVAWLTSINPLLAPGWFAGYVELRHTPVNVGDISRLNDLLADEERPLSELLSDMFDVPLFRLIMIVGLTNVGSTVASGLFVAYVLPLFAADYGGVAGIANLMLQGARNGADILWGVLA
jgi:pheromone shutdown protein TraB